MPPRPPVQVERPVGGQLDHVGMMQTAPGFRTIECVMRIRKRHPHAKWFAVVALVEPIDCPVADPGAAVPLHRQSGMPCLCGTGVRRQLGRPALQRFVSIAPAEKIPFVMLADRRTLVLARFVQMAVDNQFDMIKSHIRTAPIVGVGLGTVVALWRIGGMERGFSREMGLADKGCLVAYAGQRTCKTGFPERRVQINAVVRDTVRVRKQSRKHRSARRLTEDCRRDASGEARAPARHSIEVGRFYDTALKSETVATVLVRGDQQDIRLFHNMLLRRLALTR